MAFDKSMDKNQYSLKKFHWFLQVLPLRFTKKDFEAINSIRYELTRPGENEVSNILTKMRKLKMIRSDNIRNTREETIYFITDLYQKHYGRGKYARTTNGEQS